MAKQQPPRPDIYTLTADARGKAMADYLTTGFLAMGKQVEERVIMLEGTLVRQLRVTGKRPGEGEIAAGMKDARDKRKAGAR